MGLEETLQDMSRYGAPHLFQSSAQWVCNLNMRVNAQNVTFEVKGRGKDPSDAVVECYKNMTDAIASLASQNSFKMIGN
jgi:hypothetical protein